MNHSDMHPVGYWRTHVYISYKQFCKNKFQIVAHSMADAYWHVILAGTFYFCSPCVETVEICLTGTNICGKINNHSAWGSMSTRKASLVI